MTERIIYPTEKPFKKLEMVAMALEMESPNGATYKVEDTYLDFGQDWKWTTIVRYGYRECQVLSPKDWEDIMLATTIEDLAKIVKEIRSDKFFSDR